MAVLTVAGVRARVRGGAVGRVTAPFREPLPPTAPPGLRVIQGGNPSPVRMEGGRVVSTPRSAPQVRSSGPVATAGEPAARAFSPEPVPNQPQMRTPPPPLAPLPEDIYAHPIGTPYTLEGFKE